MGLPIFLLSEKLNVDLQWGFDYGEITGVPPWNWEVAAFAKGPYYLFLCKIGIFALIDFFFYSLYSFNQYGWGINCDSHHMNTMTAPVNSIQASTSRPCLRIISFLIVRIINYYSPIDMITTIANICSHELFVLLRVIIG